MTKNRIIGLLAACLLLPMGSVHAAELPATESSEDESLACVQHLASGSYECFQNLDAYLADRTGGKQLGITSTPGGITDEASLIRTWTQSRTHLLPQRS